MPVEVVHDDAAGRIAQGRAQQGGSRNDADAQGNAFLRQALTHRTRRLAEEKSDAPVGRKQKVMKRLAVSESRRARILPDRPTFDAVERLLRGDQRKWSRIIRELGASADSGHPY